jgi:hypothetical protein
LVIGSAQTPFNTQVARVFDFNLPGFVSGLLIGATFEYVGNDWYKLIFDRVSSNGNTNKLCIGIVPDDNLANLQYSPNPSSLSGVYIWGAQAERGDFSTTYIPTTGSAVIRAGDSISLSRPEFKKTINPKEGSYYTQFARQTLNVETPVTTIFDSPNQYWNLNTNSLVLSSLIGNVDPVVSVANIPRVTGLQPHTPIKITLGLQRDNTVIFQNQQLVTTLTSARLPTILNKFELGSFFNTKFLNGYIQVFGYWPARFSNTVLATLNGQSNAV